MKRSLLLALALILGMTAMNAATAPQLPDILGKLSALGGNKAAADTTATQSTTSAGSSSGSSLLEGLQEIGNALGIIPAKTVDVAYLTGSWSYKKPAVAFKSDNFLQKAGGTAAAAKVESELEPYYKKLGFTKMTLTVESDSTFTMAVGKIKLTGNITPAADGKSLTFNFRALGGKIGAGSMAAYVNATSTSRMDITFDVTRLVELLTKVGSITGSKSVQAISKLLSSYDGITAGFTMEKTK